MTTLITSYKTTGIKFNGGFANRTTCSCSSHPELTDFAMTRVMEKFNRDSIFSAPVFLCELKRFRSFQKLATNNALHPTRISGCAMRTFRGLRAYPSTTFHTVPESRHSFFFLLHSYLLLPKKSAHPGNAIGETKSA